jgi:hypothetical protein
MTEKLWLEAEIKKSPVATERLCGTNVVFLW